MAVYTDTLTVTGTMTTAGTVSTLVQAGASGTAGEVDIFPTTAAKGKTALTATDNTGNTTTTIVTAAQGGARTYTVPDKDGAATFMLSTATIGTSGIPGAWLPFMNFKNVDGTTLATGATAGKFGLTYTPGTGEFLITEAANSNTKTDVAAIDWLVPSTYVSGTNLTVTAHCNYTVGAGVVGTHTLAAAAYLNTTAGVQGTTLIATAAQTVPAADGAVTFTITGTTLTPGVLLTLTFTLVIQDSGGSNITAQVNSVILS